ncbi:FHF complex subunit HOOK interacting protein 2B-like isoform X2 [Poeciliopsis prolifica]|nr:FHF complex subunit HOOK interacting protein 2B-like isoform X2 [Poeciliopsis prolifica]
MTDILVYEEKQQEEPGRCLEFLLQNRLLETLCTLGKAQYPPGMSQQVLLFFSRLLSQMQKSLLQLVPVRTPVQKLIGLCALPGSCTEKEEAQFLLAICSRVSRDPQMLRYILQAPDAASSQSEASASSAVQSERGLLWVLLQLSSSKNSVVRLKACEGLLQLASLLGVAPPGPPGELQAAATQLGQLLAGRLQELYSLLPLEEIQVAELRSWPRPSWRSESADHMTRFLTWFDFLDELTANAPQALSQQVSHCVLQRWLMETLRPQLLNACELSVLASTSILCCAIRQVRSPSLLDQLLDFLLKTPSMLQLLLRRCDHASDQISVASLSLVDELLQKPRRDVLDTLVLGFLQSRRYLSSPAGGAEDRQPVSDGSDDGRDPEDDPFFSDGFPDDHLPPRLHQPAAGSAADIINSFLGLVPVQVRSAHLLQDGGYEAYVLDARSLVSQCQALSLQWAWPQTTSPPTCSSGEESDFFEGPLLRFLFEHLGRMLQQPYELNLQLTAVLSRLCAFSHPLLDEYLLDPFVHLSAGSRSLFAVLVRVVGELMERIQQVADLPQRLLDTRRHLLGLQLDSRPEHLALLQGVIVLEEFCKELAAIVFVKMSLEQNQDRFCSGPGSAGPEPAE